LVQAVSVDLRERWLMSLKPAVARIEAAQIRRTGTSVLARLFRTDVLVLVTTGRRTARERRTPLACAAIPGGWLISGGAGGQRHVDWVANLREHPAATVVVGRRTFQVTAVEPTGTEYDAARAFVIKQWPRVLGYEVAARRTVPIFELHRVEPE
jgi:deazaflavin-dependent oxidoreductase (nitroreductase family)